MQMINYTELVVSIILALITCSKGDLNDLEMKYDSPGNALVCTGEGTVSPSSYRWYINGKLVWEDHTPNVMNADNSIIYSTSVYRINADRIDVNAEMRCEAIHMGSDGEVHTSINVNSGDIRRLDSLLNIINTTRWILVGVTACLGILILVDREKNNKGIKLVKLRQITANHGQTVLENKDTNLLTVV